MHFSFQSRMTATQATPLLLFAMLLALADCGPHPCLAPRLWGALATADGAQERIWRHPWASIQFISVLHLPASIVSSRSDNQEHLQAGSARMAPPCKQRNIPQERQHYVGGREHMYMPGAGRCAIWQSPHLQDLGSQ